MSNLKIKDLFGSQRFVLEIKHSLCNETGSKISAAETKAVIKSSQELYKELLNQLQMKLDGTRGTRSTRDGNRPTETPLLLDDYHENSYESDETQQANYESDETQQADYESDETQQANSGSDETQQADYGRIYRLFISESVKVNNESISRIVQTANIFTTDEETNVIEDGRMRYTVATSGFVQRIQWTEYTKNRQLLIMAKQIVCDPFCQPKNYNLATSQIATGNATHYTTTVNGENLMILFIIKSVENTIISNIKIYGIKFVEKYDSVMVNKR